MDYIDIIEKSIYNIDSKICGIIDDYKVLQDSQKVADYVIQFLRTYLEHIAARIYAHENPNKQVPIRGKDKWYTQYMKQLKEGKDPVFNPEDVKELKPYLDKITAWNKR